MILPDANLLLYAVNSDSPDHKKARNWWLTLLSGNEEVGLCPAVVFSFVRLSTHRKVFQDPLSVEGAFAHVENWLAFPLVSWVDSEQSDLMTARELLQEAGTGGNLVTDAQIASLAIRLRATVHTADLDFGRFSRVKWLNPLNTQG
jgi:hypothetical protein